MTSETLSPTVSVLFASQTGNAQSIAQHLHQELAEKGFAPGVCSALDSLDEAKFPADDSVLVIVTSTTGDGDPPDNATKFWRWLRRCKKEEIEQRIKGRKFTILGLGDTNYTNFNQPAKRLERRLLELGAVTFYPKGLADDGTGLEQVVDPWIKDLWAALEKVAKRDGSAPAKVANGHTPDAATTNGHTESTVTPETNVAASIAALSVSDKSSWQALSDLIDKFCDETLPPHLRLEPVNLSHLLPKDLQDALAAGVDAASADPAELLEANVGAVWVPEDSAEDAQLWFQRIEAASKATATGAPELFAPPPVVPSALQPGETPTALKPLHAPVVAAKTVSPALTPASDGHPHPRVVELIVDVSGITLENGEPYAPLPGDAFGVLAAYQDWFVLPLLRALGWTRPTPAHPVPLAFRRGVFRPAADKGPLAPHLAPWLNAPPASPYDMLRTPGAWDLRPPLRKPFLTHLAARLPPGPARRAVELVVADAKAFKEAKERLKGGVGEVVASLAPAARLGVAGLLGLGCGAGVPRFFSVAWRFGVEDPAALPPWAVPGLPASRLAVAPPTTPAGRTTHVSVLASVVDGVDARVGKHVRGLATPYLETVAAAVALRPTIPVFPKPPAAFRFGARQMRCASWLLVANGTGVAPFLGAVQECRARGTGPAEVWVVHGRRYEEEDAEVVGWVRGVEGVKVVEAVSRPAGGVWPRYVQDAVRGVAGEVWRLLGAEEKEEEGGCGVFVCGSTAMAKDLHTALCDIVVEQSAAQAAATGVPAAVPDLEAAKKFWNDKAKRGLYLKDVWG
ncbi:hypothetical protein HDU96_005408 [Phlyctochytrium bullatum]|nr:hypothetical protein HDU96_005408 [Phlyctochytrium bullatum]